MNRFEGLRFARTQPPEWRAIPFADEGVKWRTVGKVAGIIALWVALFALSLWSISMSAK